MGACWKIELFTNGNLERGSTGNCSNDSFTSNAVFSYFDTIDLDSNVAVFTSGPAGFSGTFQFKQSPGIIDTPLNIIDLNMDEKEYVLEVTIPDCDIPTLEPSYSPTPSSCPIQEVEGNIFYFYAQGFCFQATFQNGGELIGDSSDGACSKENFSGSTVFSVYDSFDAESNVAVFTVGGTGYSGTFQFKQFPSAVEDVTVNILHFNATSKEYIAEIEVPSCPTPKDIRM